MEYPAQYETQCSLDDGTRIYMRPIKADDIDHMAKLFEKFSPETIYFRFFSAMRAMPIDKLKEQVQGWKEKVKTIEDRFQPTNPAQTGAATAALQSCIDDLEELITYYEHH